MLNSESCASAGSRQWHSETTSANSNSSTRPPGPAAPRARRMASITRSRRAGRRLARSSAASTSENPQCSSVPSSASRRPPRDAGQRQRLPRQSGAAHRGAGPLLQFLVLQYGDPHPPGGGERVRYNGGIGCNRQGPWGNTPDAPGRGRRCSTMWPERPGKPRPSSWVGAA